MLITFEEAKELIENGRLLHIAADESLLEKLPKGKWIGGTSPYFITDMGGITCKDKLFVNEINYAVECKAVVYDKNNIFHFSKDAYENGLVFLVMPFASEVAVRYSGEAPDAEGLLMTPTVGWISGFDLSQNGSAKVFDGFSGKSYSDKAVALHVNLPEDKYASLGIVNIFTTDEKDSTIEFYKDSFSVSKCLVNGNEVVFSDYLEENNIDTKLPLVADYNGVSINVSIKAVSNESGTVDFYAPVFAGKKYRFATPVQDYKYSFAKSIKELENVKPVFSCNCILNYLYGKLEGKATPPFSGPVTFGEIAYQLLNQTLVYVEIIDK